MQSSLQYKSSLSRMRPLNRAPRDSHAVQVKSLRRLCGSTPPERDSRFRDYLRRLNARSMTMLATIRDLEEAREYYGADVADLTRRFVGHQTRVGSLWKNSVPLVEVRRPSDGGDGDFLPVITKFGGVRLRTRFDV